MLRLSTDAVAPQADVIARVVDTLRRGGIAGIPTDTLYGLAANPFDSRAVTRLFHLKGRTADQAIPLIAASRDQVGTQLGPLNAAAARLVGRYWPGPLTILMSAPERLAPEVSAGTGRVGVRVPDHLVARALCEAFGTPLTATSANLSGRPPSNDPDEVTRELAGLVDVMLDAGRSPGGPPSTVVDVTGADPVLVRAGAIAWEEVLQCLAVE
jgi:L-threonylcarbamoyladenylate synthase